MWVAQLCPGEIGGPIVGATVAAAEMTKYTGVR